jgi:hypothetical protein
LEERLTLGNADARPIGRAAIVHSHCDAAAPLSLTCPRNRQRPERAAGCTRFEVFDAATVLGFAAPAQCGRYGLPQARLRQVDSGIGAAYRADKSVRLRATALRVSASL